MNRQGVLLFKLCLPSKQIAKSCNTANCELLLCHVQVVDSFCNRLGDEDIGKTLHLLLFHSYRQRLKQTG